MDKRGPCSLNRECAWRTGRRSEGDCNEKDFVLGRQKRGVLSSHINSRVYIYSLIFIYEFRNLIEAQVFANVMQHKLRTPCKASWMCILNSGGHTRLLKWSVLVFTKLNGFTSAEHYKTEFIFPFIWQKKMVCHPRWTFTTHDTTSGLYSQPDSIN